ncbi:MAG: Holliday junction branch migration protein RuvA [Syntrophothermus sp.]|nr:Holliday junction branch migration protein RuvA [Ignavibacteriaceae bacterium]
MIAYLKGKVHSLKPTHLIIDVNGVGYSVNISLNTYEFISDAKEVELYIFTNVKEDSITLFGFHSESEKKMFELLISVNGIGPKSALSILSGIKIDDLKTAIALSDISRIVAVPGIGKKTAERLVLELKSKIDSVQGETTLIAYDKKNEAIAALTTLGYNIKQAEKVIQDVLSTSPNLPLEELLKKALGMLIK